MALEGYRHGAENALYGLKKRELSPAQLKWLARRCADDVKRIDRLWHALREYLLKRRYPKVRGVAGPSTLEKMNRIVPGDKGINSGCDLLCRLHCRPLFSGAVSVGSIKLIGLPFAVACAFVFRNW
jgi:hypothetical protein